MPNPNETGTPVTPQPTPSPEPIVPVMQTAEDNAAALHAAIEKARVEERTKLYGTLNDEKKKVESLTNTLTDVQRKNQELSKNLKALEKARTDKGDVDVAKLVEEVAQNAAARVLEETSATVTDLKSRLEMAESRATKTELELFKKEAIAQAGGEGNLITALVGGNSKEEIVDSIVRAKAEMQKILLRVTPGSGAAPLAPSSQQTQDGNQRGASSVPPVLPSSNRAGAADGSSLQSVRSLNAKDYKAQRDKIMADLKSRHS